MNWRLGALVGALLCFGAGGCGEARNGGGLASKAPSTVTATLPQPELKGDPDDDSDSYGREPDSDTTRIFGHAADARDARAVTALIERYYKAAAAEDGAAACDLMYSVLSESVAEDYGGGAGASYLRGNTCAQVMSKLFEQMHERLRADNATLKVAAVRVHGRRGSVLMSFEGGRAVHYLEVRRELGVWKVNRLIDNEQPVLVE
jgi:hypothetical protein